MINDLSLRKLRNAQYIQFMTDALAILQNPALAGL